MAITAPTSWIEVRGDTDPYKRDLRGLDSVTARAGTSASGAFSSRFSSGMKRAVANIGRIVAVGLGAVVIGAGVLIKGAFEQAQEALGVEAQTTAVLKSTERAAQITGKEIDRLTTSIMGYAAISDESVRQGVNMLLTFKNIRNESGKNNDIFNQSTKALIDMSVAMGREPQQAAIMLGKALNDPIKGLAAMNRVGIQFTEQQETQITKMVEAGDVMGAQKIILKELESQFGGSAKAVGRTKPWEKITLIFGEMQEGLGKALIPTLNDLADRLLKFVKSKEFQQWLEDAEKWLTENIPKAIKKLERFFGDLAEFWREDGQTIVDTIGAIKDGFLLVTDVITGDWASAMQRIKEPWQETWNWVARIFGNAASAILGGFKWLIDKIIGSIEWLLDKAIAIMEPLPGKLEGPLIAARKKVGDFRSETNKNLGDVQDKLNSLGETTKKWGGTSRKEVTGVGNEIGNLTDKIQKLTGMSRININANIADFGAGFPIPGSGSTPTARANALMGAVPGFQMITSRYRPGDDGFHGVAPPWNAVDIGGENLTAIYDSAVAKYGASIKEMILDHNIYEHGVERYYAPSDHTGSDRHVHFADQGGEFLVRNRSGHIGLVGIGPGVQERVTFHGAEKIGPGPGARTQMDIERAIAKGVAQAAMASRRMELALELDGRTISRQVTLHQERNHLLLQGRRS